ncbi:MAG: class I SAM-dependent methyltransferase [Candidatus Diapherotrites archaeon]|nr:class I SAM-dependent methyltransferase [Candidatus Diapherotrites archaeon]
MPTLKKLDSVERNKIADQLRRGRTHDQKRNWGTSYSSGIKGPSLFPIHDVVPILNKLVESKKTKPRILDLGCTEGRCLKELFGVFGNKLEYHGMSLARFNEWKKTNSETNNYLNFRVGHAEALGNYFKKNHFDVIRSSLAIAHSNNLAKAIQEVRKVLKKGGLFIFSDDRVPTQKEIPGFSILDVQHFGFSKSIILKKIN